MQLDEIEANREEFTATGIEAIRQGKVAAVLLAGGMGTRLGSDNPKGMYNVGLTHELYIFECLINNLMEVVHQADSWIHLFVMTSDKNNDATIAFLKEHDFFGYNAEYVHFFKQEMAAATDYEGKIYLEEKGKLSTSPNGNGGWFISMKNNGMLDIVHREGIEWINVFAVDNCLQRIADPLFIGATIAYGCESGAKVVRKAAPDEKVGVLCTEDGKPSIDMNGYKGSDSLISQDLIKGKGAVVKDTQSVVAHYTGWLLDGTQFDSSWDRGQSSAFSLDSVIKGWKQGLAGHTVGSQVLLVVPPSLGYGNKDQEKIPANSTLVFVVDILAAY